MSADRTLSPHQRAAWNALELGPLWRPRAGPAVGPGGEEDAALGVEPGARECVPSVVPDSSGPGPVEPPGGDAAESVPMPAVPAVAAPGASAGAPAGVPVDEARPPAARPGVTAREQAIAAMPWEELAASVAGCTACGLCESRQQTVFGVGDAGASWMLIGEAPGSEEDARGEPFVGQAGRLLDAMLAAIGLDRRHDVFITNTLKCRPPGNRNPQPAETAACASYLRRQIELVEPRIIVALGRFAAQSLLGTDASIGSLRGRVHPLRVGDREFPLVVTYHPAYLLRSLPEKAKTWRDLRLAVETHAAQV